MTNFYRVFTGFSRQALRRFPAPRRFEHALDARGVLGQQLCWPSRTWQQLSATVGTASVQHLRRTAGAEGALEGADHGVARVGRQITIAAFAVGTKLKHGDVTSQ